MVFDIICFIIILSVIIIVHELGHLIAAKRFNVYCKEFSIGMGPILWQRQKGETAWSIRALPIGGYVAMAGEDGVDEDEELSIPYERTINGAKKWKQIIILAAGAFMNIMLAWLLFIGITAYQGEVSVDGPPVVASVLHDKPAQIAGIQPKDRITKMASGKDVVYPKNWMDVSEFLMYHHGTMQIQVQRDKKDVNLKLTPYEDRKSGQYMLGVQQDPSSYTTKKITLLEAIPYGTQKMVTSVSTIFDALGNLVHGVGLQNLSGPVGIFNVTSQVAKEGWLSIIALIALLSVNVGIFNLLPIPILDGGRILIVLIEALIGRRLNERLQNAIMMAGLIVIIGVMVFATWNDITRLL